MEQNTEWGRQNACFSYKNNFVYFQHKKVSITQKEGILMHFKVIIIIIIIIIINIKDWTL